MIRSTKHTTKFANREKKTKLKAFITESRRIAKLYLDYLWNHSIEFPSKDIIKIMDITNNLLEHPRMFNYNLVEPFIPNFQTNLSARARTCIITQVLGV
jgi:hypothetical protein